MVVCVAGVHEWAFACCWTAISLVASKSCCLQLFVEFAYQLVIHTQEDCSKTRCCNELGTTCQTKSQSESRICWTVCSFWPKATLVKCPCVCRWCFPIWTADQIHVEGLLLYRTKLAPSVIHHFVLPPVQVLSEEWLVGILQSQLHRRQMWKSRTCTMYWTCSSTCLRFWSNTTLSTMGVGVMCLSGTLKLLKDF